MHAVCHEARSTDQIRHTAAFNRCDPQPRERPRRLSAWVAEFAGYWPNSPPEHPTNRSRRCRLRVGNPVLRLCGCARQRLARYLHL